MKHVMYDDIDALQWRHNGLDSVSNHQPQVCLLKRLFRHKWKKTSKLRVTALCEGNSPETVEVPTQRASNAESISIWLRHHVHYVYHSVGTTMRLCWFSEIIAFSLKNVFENIVWKMAAILSRPQCVNTKQHFTFWSNSRHRQYSSTRGNKWGCHPRNKNYSRIHMISRKTLSSNVKVDSTVNCLI